MITTSHDVHFQLGRKSKKQLAPGPAETEPAPVRIPRVAKIMALAIRFDWLIRNGHVKDQAELARLGHVSRAWLTQIMMLLHLAPDIQEQILHLTRSNRGREPMIEKQLRSVAAIVCWNQQRKLWRQTLAPQPDCS